LFCKLCCGKLDRLFYNPVLARIVENPEDYLYSSARNYWGLQGLIDVILVEPMIEGRA